MVAPTPTVVGTITDADIPYIKRFGEFILIPIDGDSGDYVRVHVGATARGLAGSVDWLRSQAAEGATS